MILCKKYSLFSQIFREKSTKSLNYFNVLKKYSIQRPKSSINQNFSMGKNIPDRWLDYSKIGNQVEGTSFIPFKVPLHVKICENLPETARLTTRDIIEALPNVGLVINLTNTKFGTKYYEPNDWKSEGIDYKWIKVEGHVTPSQHLLVQFCNTVKEFMLANPSKLIGIHCTHGLNRTGYFVCSYMVLALSIPPDEAIKRFADARGYEIERQNYVNSIISHDVNMSLKQIVSTLPILMPKTSDGKRRNETEIDSTRYDDRKMRKTNYGSYSKSNVEHSWKNSHSSSRYYHSSSFSRHTDSRSRFESDNRESRNYRNDDRYSRRSNGNEYGAPRDAKHYVGNSWRNREPRPSEDRSRSGGRNSTRWDKSQESTHYERPSSYTRGEKYSWRSKEYETSRETNRQGSYRSNQSPSGEPSTSKSTVHQARTSKDGKSDSQRSNRSRNRSPRRSRSPNI